MSARDDVVWLLKTWLIVVLGLATAVVLLFAGMAIYNYYDDQAFGKRSPIAAMSKLEFQERVYARFPIGPKPILFVS